MLREVRRATVGLRDDEIPSDHPLRNIRTRIIILSLVPLILLLGVVSTAQFAAVTGVVIALAGVLFLIGIWSPPPIPLREKPPATVMLYVLAVIDFSALVVLGAMFMMALAHSGR